MKHGHGVTPSRKGFLKAAGGMVVAGSATGVWSETLLPFASHAADAAGPQRGGVFHIAFPSDVPTGDPAHAGYDLESWALAVTLYNGLMNYRLSPPLHPELPPPLHRSAV